MTRSYPSALAALAVALFVFLAPATGRADAGTDARVLINRATTAVERIRGDEAFREDMQPLLNKAKAVLVIPSFVKAGFIVGGAYGHGVLLARSPGGGWSHPAFYRMVAGSLGLQIGVQDSEIMFIIMTEKGLNAVMQDKFKIGADIGVAMATVGAGMSAATTSAGGADIYAFSRAAGLYGGGAIEGAIIEPNGDYTAAYYGTYYTPEQVVLQGQGRNAQADKLRSLLGD